LEGRAGDGFKSLGVHGAKLQGNSFSGNWQDGNEAIDLVTSHNALVEFCQSTTGMFSIKGGSVGCIVRNNSITSPREAMRDGEAGASRSSRSIPTDPPFPWAEAYKSEWHHNYVKTTSTTREPGWVRGSKAGNYHDNFFDGPASFRGLRFLSANAAYYQNASYGSVPAADQPYIRPITNATFDYATWCRSNTVLNNAFRTGMTSGSLKDADQGSLLTESGWFAASSFEAAFPGVTVGPAGWDHQQIRYKVGLI
jgi:hypothetical protein